MSRSNKGGKGPGYDYNQSREGNGKWRMRPGSVTKKYTHKRERRIEKEILDEEKKELPFEDYRGDDDFDWNDDSLYDNFF